MGTTAQVFHPVNVDWDGVDPADYEKLQEALPAGTTGGTQAQFAADGTRRDIQLRPYVAHGNAGIDSAYGWAINLDGADGMDVPAHAEQRRILAGTWNFTGQVRAAPVAALNAVHVRIRVYKYNSGGTRTQQGSEGTQNMGTLAANDTNFNINITDVPEIILNDGETVVVAYHINAQGQLGDLTIIMATGNFAVGNDTVVTIPSPGVRSRYLRTHSSRMAGIATIKKTKRFHPVNFGGTRMAGIATTTRRFTLRREFAGRMAGVATVKKVKRFHPANFGSTRMAGVATIRKKKRFDPANFGSTRMAGVATVKKLIRLGTTTFPAAAMRGVATMTRRLTLYRGMTARMAGVATMVRVVRNRRTFMATMLGRAKAFIKLPFERVPGGGGTTIIKKIIQIFDD